MKKSIGILIALLASTSIIAQVQKKETAHFSAKFDSETEAYAIASLQVLDAAWTISKNNGFDIPNRIKFSIRKSDRNALYFNRKSLKEITWEYESLEDFLPPDQGGKNCVYGLCHEIGHLCMYNTNHNRNSWMSYDYRESWADYFGNIIIDSLYRELGIDFWPEQHEYNRYAGMDYFLKRIEKNNPELQSFNNSGLFWYELGNEIGFSNIHMFFNSIEAHKVDNPGAMNKFIDVLKLYLEGRDVEAWFEQYAKNLIKDGFITGTAQVHHSEKKELK